MTTNQNDTGDWYATRPRSATDNRATIHRTGCRHRTGDFVWADNNSTLTTFTDQLRNRWGVTGPVTTADCC